MSSETFLTNLWKNLPFGALEMREVRLAMKGVTIVYAAAIDSWLTGKYR
jgi:hypothetical protein